MEFLKVLWALTGEKSHTTMESYPCVFLPILDVDSNDTVEEERKFVSIENVDDIQPYHLEKNINCEYSVQFILFSQ